ncbi:MAG: hypothetical protein VX589_06400 [Myxococcota bacterium]|nr:hypothetical protein [Myxococcota bacterium]
MKRFFCVQSVRTLCTLCWTLCMLVPTSSLAQASGQGWQDALGADESIYVVVGRIDGSRNRRRHLVSLQKSLRAHAGVRVESTQRFEEQARRLRVMDSIPEDASALADACDAADVDAAVFVQFVRERRSSQNLIVSIYAGDSGRFIGERIFELGRTEPNRALWRQVGREVVPLIRAAAPAEAASPERRPPPRRPIARQRPKVERPEIPVETVSRPIDAEARPLLAIQAGPYAMSRSFKYDVDPTSLRFTDGGIDYELGFVPGFAVQLELMPLARTSLTANGILGYAAYETVFFRTQQTICQADVSTDAVDSVTGDKAVMDDGCRVGAPVDSTYFRLALGLGYRFLFPADVEFTLDLGFALRSFEIPNSDEYRGNRYTSMVIGLASYVPFGTPYIGARVRVELLPLNGLGDTLQELGGDATTLGYSIRGGFESRLPFGMFVMAEVDYTGLSLDISGEGRDGRVGKEASDSFLGTQLVIGYRY